MTLEFQFYFNPTLIKLITSHLLITYFHIKGKKPEQIENAACCFRTVFGRTALKQQAAFSHNRF
ncbi:hypothetical protein DC20_03855 [Rufibacter tibetensis]|uniref:Uncharacterized protein n=1 Tax=Rufibacter tibetensis TaxID=512763 RepID=A0A0P0C148_9BACT|nr:hypothetical protein DC20_03855 [Rufibacter tibetensis]